MKATCLPLIALLLLPAGHAVASDEGHDGTRVTSSCCDAPTRWAPRHDLRDTRLAITTEDRKVMLLITDRVVAFQLSERTMKKLRAKLRDSETEDDDNALGAAIKAVVLVTVRELVSHSAECPAQEIRSIDLRDGRLEFRGENGEPVFENLAINDVDELSGFTQRDAQAFIEEFHRVKARLH